MSTKTDYKFGEVHGLLDQLQYGADKVHCKNIFETANGGASLLAFSAGQALDTHLAPAEVMVIVLEGEIEFTMGGNPNTLKAGEFLLMGAEVPHSVVAKSDAKVLLFKIKD